MKNKGYIGIFVMALACLAVLLGASLTGLVIYKVEYNDLCRADDDCPNNQCCVIYPERNLGLCMDHCQSLDFLCTADGQCEEGTVCCLPEGKDFGICNYPEKCMNVDVFAEYIGKFPFLGKPSLNIESPGIESPAPVYRDASKAMKAIIVAETLALIALIIFIIWLLSKRPAKRARK